MPRPQAESNHSHSRTTGSKLGILKAPDSIPVDRAFAQRSGNELDRRSDWCIYNRSDPAQQINTLRIRATSYLLPSHYSPREVTESAVLSSHLPKEADRGPFIVITVPQAAICTYLTSLTATHRGGPWMLSRSTPPPLTHDSDHNGTHPRISARRLSGCPYLIRTSSCSPGPRSKGRPPWRRIASFAT